MDSCKITREKLIEYLEGTLSLKQDEQVREHISTCTTCRRHLEELSKLSNVLTSRLEQKADSVELPPMLWGKILKSVQENKKQSKVAVWWKVAAGVAAALAIMFTGTFAPVFGKEGNLLNVMSGSIVNGPVEELVESFSDDLLGQLKKSHVFVQFQNDTGVTDEQRWELIEKGYTPGDIVLTLVITKEGDWTFDEVVESRDEGYGWGRIANWAGISILSVAGTVASLLGSMKEEVDSKTEFEVDSQVEGFDDSGNLVLSDFNSPIPFDENNIELVDEDGTTPINPSDLPEFGANLTFRIVDGKPHPQMIKRQRQPHDAPPPNHIVLKVKIESVDADGLTVVDDNGFTRKVIIIREQSGVLVEPKVGDTVVMAIFAPAPDRQILKSMRPPLHQRPPHFSPQDPPPPFPPGDDNQASEGGFDTPKTDSQPDDAQKPEIKGAPKAEPLPENRGDSKHRDNDNVIEGVDEDNNTNTSGDGSASDNERFEDKIVTFESFDRGRIATDSGEYLLGDGCNVLIKLVEEEIVIRPEILNRVKSGTKLSISGVGDVIGLIKVDIQLDRGRYRFLNYNALENQIQVLDNDRNQISFACDSSSTFIPNLRDFRKGFRVEIFSRDGFIFILRLEQQPMDSGEPINGEIEKITNDGFMVNDRKFDVIPGTTDFILVDPRRQGQGQDKQPISFDDLEPGMPVTVVVYHKDNSGILALRVVVLTQKPGEGAGGSPNNDMKKKIVDYRWDTANNGALILTLSSGANIKIDSDTPVLKVIQDKVTGPVALKDLRSINLNGLFVQFKVGQRGKIVELRIHFPE